MNGSVSNQQIDDVSVIFAGKNKSSKENRKGDGNLFTVLRFDALVEGDETRMTRPIIYFPLFFSTRRSLLSRRGRVLLLINVNSRPTLDERIIKMMIPKLKIRK